MRKIKKVLPIALTALVLAVPLVAFAQFRVNNAEWTPNEEVMAAETDIGAIIVTVIQWIMGIVGLICVIMIIYGGVTYATAAGVEERIETGKKILMWAIVGLIISIVAFTLAKTIVGMFGVGG